MPSYSNYEKLPKRLREVADCAAAGTEYRGDPWAPTEVDGRFLAALVLDRIKGLEVHPRGVMLAHCVVAGPMRLAQAVEPSHHEGRAAFPFSATDCVFQQTPDLAQARVSTFTLQRSWLPGLKARGASIGGQLDLSWCRLRPSDNADHSGTGQGSAYLIDLDGATIAGDFFAKNLLCIEPQLPAGFADVEIDADNTRIAGEVDIGQVGLRTWRGGGERIATIYANFDNTDIFGDFRAFGARLRPVLGRASSRPDASPSPSALCLDLRGAAVRGTLDLRYVDSRGVLRTEDATISQDLELGGGRLVNPMGLTLEGVSLSVGGSIHFVDRRAIDAEAAGEPAATGAQAKGDDPASTQHTRRDPRLWSLGQLRLTRAEVGTDFDASGATVCAVHPANEGVALDLRSARIAGSVYLDARQYVGPALFVGLINLIHIEVGGSVIFAGSWFRAPAGQLMEAENILEEIEASTEEGVADTNYAKALQEFLQERNRSRLLDALGILTALRRDNRELWRLRGGYRAIALEDARVSGAVLFGTAMNVHRVGGAVLTADGPSFVVGCVDMDRVRIAGDLRLTGGIFRALTPIVETLAKSQGSARSEPRSDGDPMQPVGDHAHTGGPEVSLSYPSTAGWAESMSRRCLSLRNARIDGRLDTKFFGHVPFDYSKVKSLPYLEPDRSSADAPDSGTGKTTCEKLVRRDLVIVPGGVVLESLIADGPERADSDYTAFDPVRYAVEMTVMLALVAQAEAHSDHKLWVSAPRVPAVMDYSAVAEPIYRLRPDGLFDLSGASVSAIHDDPLHGWPTSDGQLQLNGCSYDFMTLGERDTSLRAFRIRLNRRRKLMRAKSAQHQVESKKDKDRGDIADLVWQRLAYYIVDFIKCAY